MPFCGHHPSPRIAIVPSLSSGAQHSLLHATYGAEAGGTRVRGGGGVGTARARRGGGGGDAAKGDGGKFQQQHQKKKMPNMRKASSGGNPTAAAGTDKKTGPDWRGGGRGQDKFNKTRDLIKIILLLCRCVWKPHSTLVVHPLLNMPGELGVLLRFRRTETPHRQQTLLDAPSRDLRKTSPTKRTKGTRDATKWGNSARGTHHKTSVVYMVGTIRCASPRGEGVEVSSR